MQQIETFKRENELSVDSTPDTGAEGAAAGVDFDDEIDLRAEDDALIAAELEAEQAKAAEEAAAAEAAAAAAAEAAAAAGEDESEADKAAATRRRGRRGRGRRTKNTLEGSFDHGEEGYGLWLDPAVEENPLYAEHWAGHRPVEVTIEADRIIIRRASAGDGEDET
ncbi:MAG: hypothetical protein JWP17_3565 [Solirubrobacterales bacterium]|nr:hypothetical protein [Solirubrobacterales bacterium]